jgi:hypothetical protein
MATNIITALPVALALAVATLGSAAAGGNVDNMRDVTKVSVCDAGSDSTCMSARCMPMNAKHGQNTVGPTFPMACRQIAALGARIDILG